MKLFNNIFSNKSNDLRRFIDEGAVIIDVRTAQEYNSGHVKGSKNIPLERLKSRIDEVREYNKPVITICQSGMRSGTAASILEGKGIKVINGGSWAALNRIV